MALPPAKPTARLTACWGTTRRMGCGHLDPACAEGEGAEYGVSGVDSASVIATHVNKIVRSYIPICLTMMILRSCITVWRRWHRPGGRFKRGAQLQPVAESVPALLTEGVSLRDIVTIATVLVPVAR